MTRNNLSGFNLVSYVVKMKDKFNNFLLHDIIDEGVEKIIMDSWIRSKKKNVNPYDTYGAVIRSIEDANEKKLSPEELQTAFGSVIPFIEEVMLEKQLSLLLFDKSGKNIRLSMFSAFDPYTAIENSDSTFLGDLTEGVIGTNAICLALQHDMPVQIIGPEHYNVHLHNFFCCAAPIHNRKRELIGVINIFSSLDNYFVGALSLVTCLASIFDNRALIQNIFSELNVHELAIKNIIEQDSKGVVYIKNDGSIKYYNTKILNLFNINKKDKEKEELSKFVSSLKLEENRLVDNKEVVISLPGKKKSFLVSTQHLTDSEKIPIGKIIFVDDTDDIYKKFQKLRGNKAIYTFDDIVGNNSELVRAKKLAEKIANTSSSVLIFGESGTGKELFAQAIHNASPRHLYPFVSINCGAIPPELIESELFGYEAGAYTGALRGGKPGKLELASEGTLFLDEVESMPLSAQIKLLRALSSQQISRIGSIEEISINIRVIAATKTNLLEEADNGSFREDLYYRISTIIIKLPPLRERVDDIPILVKHLLHINANQNSLESIAVCDDFIKALQCLTWRGNVRELSNVIERSIALSDGGSLSNQGLLMKTDAAMKHTNVDDIGSTLKEKFDKRQDEDDSKGLLRISEEIAIDYALTLESNNIARAAKRLGISKPTLYAKLKKYHYKSGLLHKES